MKKRIITGLTATGKLTLGNYLGSLVNINKYTNEYDVSLFVADLHGLTTNPNADILRQTINENIKLYYACGIDFKKVKVFVQSKIKEHSELFYLLISNVNLGELERMTQYKDKASDPRLKQANNTYVIPAGLLVYPVLMAADILLYNVDGVIVGDDQKQHLELTRTIAERMNFRYKTSFKSPETITPKVGARIMALKDPLKKMSKSDADATNTIFLLDPIEVARKKIMSSLTDNENKVYYDVKNKPGVSNLITIYSAIKNISIEEAQKELEHMNYKEFKEAVANEVCSLLESIQNKYNNINENELKNQLNINENELRTIAQHNLDEIQKKMGLK